MNPVFKGKTAKGLDILIRYPYLEDLEHLSAYASRIYSERSQVGVTGGKRSLEETKKDLVETIKFIEGKKEVCLFAFSDNKLIGKVSIKTGERMQSHVGFLTISVDQGYRNKGLGKTLLDLAIKETKHNISEPKYCNLTRNCK